MNPVMPKYGKGQVHPRVPRTVRFPHVKSRWRLQLEELELRAAPSDMIGSLAIHGVQGLDLLDLATMLQKDRGATVVQDRQNSETIRRIPSTGPEATRPGLALLRTATGSACQASGDTPFSSRHEGLLTLHTTTTSESDGFGDAVISVGTANPMRALGFFPELDLSRLERWIDRNERWTEPASVRNSRSPVWPVTTALQPALPTLQESANGFGTEMMVNPRSFIQRDEFRSVQVNVNSSGNNIVGDAANEPSIAIDPTNPNRMSIGWRQFNTITSNFRQAGWAYTQNAGQNWTFPGVLQPGQFRSDPVLESNTQGVFFYYSLSTTTSCEMFRSTNGGVSWTGPTAAFGGDKAWMTIDKTNGIGKDNIYASWQRFFSCCGSNIFVRSVNGGNSFQTPVPVAQSPLFGTIDVGPDGEVYVAGIRGVDFQDFNTFVIARSSNAQNPSVSPTFEHSAIVNMGGSLGFGGEPNPGGLMGQVWVATDHSQGSSRGNVYLLASVDPPGPDPMDVMFSRSTDRGVTWSTPMRINDDPLTNNAWQWFGTLSVAPDGRIDVVWNDTRTMGQSQMSETFTAYSLDGGQTWSRNIPMTPVWNSHLGWPNQQKIGDYYDMVSDNFAAHLAYSATFLGEQNVYYLRAAPDCNRNGIHDGSEILAQTSRDRNRNLTPDECDADFNRDGLLNLVDIDALVAEIAAGTHQARFNLTEDPLVNLDDRDAWLAAAGQVNLGPGRVYLLGDANLDRFVDRVDFDAWYAHRFTNVAAWSRGDFNANAAIDGEDFGIWNQNNGQSA